MPRVHPNNLQTENSRRKRVWAAIIVVACIIAIAIILPVCLVKTKSKLSISTNISIFYTSESTTTRTTILTTTSGVTNNLDETSAVNPSYWMPDQSLSTGRRSHKMALLSNGKVIVAGGMIGIGGTTSSCEFYTSSTGWQQAVSMKTARYHHTLTPFDNNTKLLATGGFNVRDEKTAEIYDSVTDTWTLTGTDMSIKRAGHSATLLGNGQILIVGGFDIFLNVSSTTEIYVPSSNSFLNTNNMISSRQSATSTLLSDGSTVLVTGGVNDRRNITGTAELYVNGSWIRTTSNMNKFRAYHAAVLLNDGNVLIAGGGDFSASFATAEIYNATTRTFTAVGSMKYPRMDFTLTLLPSGKVLATGGADLKTNTHPPVCELYDPVTRSWSDTHLLNDARASHQSVLLNDSVLTVGGFKIGIGNNNIASSEKYYL